MKKVKKTVLELPYFVCASVPTHGMKMVYSNQDESMFPQDAFVAIKPTLWLVQKGRKRASFTNDEAARAFAGKSGKIRAFVEVQA